jgi:hypothetical protein
MCNCTSGNLDVMSLEIPGSRLDAPRNDDDDQPVTASPFTIC